MMDIIDLLKNNSDEGYDKFNKSLIPGVGKTYGVRVPVLRQIAEDLMKEDWISYLHTKSDSQEELMIKAIIIQKAKMDMKERLKYSDEFIPLIDNWAVSDIFCGKWKLSENENEDLWKFCTELMKSDDEFKMRVGIVMMMKNHLDDKHIEEILKIAIEFYHPGYYYRMGVAWCLSFAYTEYPELTEKAILSGKLDADVLNKTVRKICDSYRVNKECKERLKAAKNILLS